MTRTNQNKKMPLQPNCIVVPERRGEGGLDFEPDPYNVDLRGILTLSQYAESMKAVNARLSSNRKGAVDSVLLATGPLIVPLAVWGIRHRKYTKQRERLLNEAIEDFHAHHPSLHMSWNKKPQSILTIERNFQ